MLTAYIDDSGTHTNDPAIVVLAGFMSTPERWAAFSAEWQAACLGDPPTPDFHMSEAWSVFGAYWGHEENPALEGDELARRRDARITNLIEIVRRHVIVGMHTGLNPQTYDQLLRGNVPAHVDSQYFILFWQLQMAATKWCMDNGLADEQIRFVFDDQSDIGLAAAEWHEAVVLGIPPRAAAMLLPPQFAHDRDTVQLKAADIAAWTIHRSQFEARAQARGDTPIRPLYPMDLLRRIPVFGSPIDRDLMLKLIDILKAA